MRRRLSNLLTALSLLLCAAVCVLWVRSYWYADQSGYIGKSHTVALNSWRGRLMWSDGNLPVGSTDWWYPRRLTGAETDSRAFQATWLGRRGFIYRTHETPAAVMGRWHQLGLPRALPPVIHSRYIAVPHWLPALVFAVLPAARLSRRISRPHPAGFCRSCGYDLRATPGRCPECGAVAASGPTDEPWRTHETAA